MLMVRCDPAAKMPQGFNIPTVGKPKFPYGTTQAEINALWLFCEAYRRLNIMARISKRSLSKAA